MAKSKASQCLAQPGQEYGGGGAASADPAAAMEQGAGLSAGHAPGRLSAQSVLLRLLHGLCAKTLALPTQQAQQAVRELVALAAAVAAPRRAQLGAPALHAALAGASVAAMACCQSESTH